MLCPQTHICEARVISICMVVFKGWYEDSRQKLSVWGVDIATTLTLPGDSELMNITLVTINF
jgi:hypothetical protein